MVTHGGVYPVPGQLPPPPQVNLMDGGFYAKSEALGRAADDVISAIETL